MRFRIFFPIFRLSKHIIILITLLYFFIQIQFLTNPVSIFFSKEKLKCLLVFFPLSFFISSSLHIITKLSSLSNQQQPRTITKNCVFFSFIRKFLERHSCPKNDNTFLYYYESESFKKPFIRKLYF